MIIDFTIKNFRSYKEETTFTFEALDNNYHKDSVFECTLKDGRHFRLLKSAAILGSNGSGKSNIIWALFTLIEMVKHSRNYDIRQPLPYTPFILSPNTRSKCTEFTLNFIVKETQYRYVIHFDHSIHNEGLYKIIDNKVLCIYNLRLEQTKGYSLEAGEAWQSTTFDISNIKSCANHLFLSEMGVRPVNGLEEIYKYIANIVVLPVDNSINLKQHNDIVASTILKDEKIFQQLKHLIKASDIGIKDIEMQEYTQADFIFPDSVSSQDKERFIQDNKWKFNMIHVTPENENIPLDIKFESTGTKYLFGLASRVLKALYDGGILIYDEMNIAIHSNLFKYIVSLFNDVQSNPHHAQLLFSTHDTTIITNETMRSDQVWFVQKNSNGESELFSAQDFEDVNINSPFDYWYRSGRFGAIPQFGNKYEIFNNEK